MHCSLIATVGMAVLLMACKREDLPPIGQVWARIGEPIARSCKDVLPVATAAVSRHGSSTAGPPRTNNQQGGFEIEGGWKYADPEPYGYRILATLTEVGPSACKVEVRSQNRPYPRSSFRFVEVREAELDILRAFDPAKADEIEKLLRKYKM